MSLVTLPEGKILAHKDLIAVSFLHLGNHAIFWLKKRPCEWGINGKISLDSPHSIGRNLVGKSFLYGIVAQDKDKKSTSVLQVIMAQPSCDLAERAILTMMLHKTKKNEISLKALLFQLRLE